MVLPKKIPEIVDVHVGSRVRLQRTLLGMSQDKLGKALGLTFQQIQKYERGANRIGSSRLYQLSRILDVPISYFFEGINDDEDNSLNPLLDSLITKKSISFMRDWAFLSDKQKTAIHQVVKSMNEAE